LRYALSKKTLLETALIRCARAATTVALEEILAQVKALRAGAAAPPAPAAAPARVMESRPAMATVPVAASQPAAAPAVENKPPVEVKDELAALVKDWHALVERVGHAAPLAKSNLLDAAPVAINGSQVVIGFDPEFADRVEQVALPRNRAALQKVLGEALRRSVTVEFKLLPSSPGEPAAPPPPPAATTAPAEAAPAAAKGPLRGRHKWMAQESVQKTLDMFNGRILDIKE
jgi:hypothetical protein